MPRCVSIIVAIPQGNEPKCRPPELRQAFISGREPAAVSFTGLAISLRSQLPYYWLGMMEPEATEAGRGRRENQTVVGERSRVASVAVPTGLICSATVWPGRWQASGRVCVCCCYVDWSWVYGIRGYLARASSHHEVPSRPVSALDLERATATRLAAIAGAAP